MPTRQRPSSVTLLVALQAILAVLFVLGIFASTAVGFGLRDVAPHIGFFSVRLSPVVIVLFLFTVIEFISAFGVWNGMNWASRVSLTFAVFGIIFFVFSLFLRPGVGEVAALIIDLLVLYCLIQPQVQSYFRKGATAPA